MLLNRKLNKDLEVEKNAKICKFKPVLFNTLGIATAGP